MKISSRYTIYSLAASAVPLGLVVIVLYSLTHRELERMRADDIKVAEHVLESSFASAEEDVSAKLRIVSNDLEWTRLLLKRNGDGRIDQLALIEMATDYSQKLGLSYIELISPDSNLLARSRDYSSFNIGVARPALDTLGSREVISGLAAVGIAGKSAIHIMASIPMYYKGDLIAYMQGGREVDRPFMTRLENLTGTILDLRSVADAGPASTGMLSDGGVAEGPEGEIFRMTIRAIDEVGGFILTVIQPESEVERLLEKSLRIYAILALGGIVLAGAIGYFSSRRLTVPIGELVEAAEEIAEGRFERRIIWFAKDELGTLVEGFNTMYDRLKRSQEQLIQSEKIAAWSQMARKVAHEIKNPLTPIQVSVEDLKRSYDSKEPGFDQILSEAVETVSAELTRLRRLTDEFSRFARLPSPVLEKNDIRPVVADALRIYGEEIRSGRLKVRFPQSHVPVYVDAELFSQVMVNLVKNALEATEPDGSVAVTGELGRGIVRLVVEDDGPGIPDDQASRIFTPYFTTKKGGTGLGLVIAYRIVFDHGGRIRYEKGDARGARFVVILPLAEKSR